MLKDDYIPFHQSFQTGSSPEKIFAPMDPNHLQGGGPGYELVKEYFNNKWNMNHLFLTPSCTSALEMASLLLDIKPGDEVIVPSFTFVTSASSFAMRGAKIVYVDIDPETLCADIEFIERSITSKTKAVVYVHYGGWCGDIERLKSLCNIKNVHLVEDAAQAVGSIYKGVSLGKQGDISCFSFHATKNIHCGEGGALNLNNTELLEKAEIIFEKGTDRKRFQREEVEFYQWKELGSSFLMNELSAFYLWDQLQNLEDNIETRRSIWQSYEKEFEGLKTNHDIKLPPPVSSWASCHIYYIVLNSPEQKKALQDHLQQNGIQTASHYFPLHLSEFGARYHDPSIKLAVTGFVSERLLRLPIYPQMKDWQPKIIDKVLDFFNQNN